MSGGDRQQGYQASNYALGQSLPSMAGVDPGHSQYQYVLAGYNDAQAAAQREQQLAGMFESMFSNSGSSQSSGPSYEQQLADQQAAADAAAEKARIAEGRRQRDSYISNYFDAANEATSFVTDKIAAEEANAALMGVNYTMNDALKSERIANYFGTLWSEGAQTELDSALKSFGASGFEQSIFRGAGTEAGPVEAGVGQETMSTGIKNVLTDEEDTLGGETVLGSV